MVTSTRSDEAPGPAGTADLAGSWRSLAACRGHTEVMFPDRPQGTNAIDFLPALTICDACPVVEPCRAAGAGEAYGVWGGTTPAGRRRAARAA